MSLEGGIIRLSSISELTDEVQRDILRRAIALIDRAQSPITSFGVGAVAQTRDEAYYGATNIEYFGLPGLSNCAERAALQNVAAAGYKRNDVVRIGVAGRPLKATELSQVTPCGLCAEAILDWERALGKPIEIIASGGRNEVLRIVGARSLFALPYDFDKASGK